MKYLQYISLCLALLAAGIARGADAPSPASKPYVFNGVDFFEVRHLTDGPIETFEYLRRGETLTTWAQLVTHQQITTQQPLDKIEFRADEYAQNIRRQLNRDNKAQPTQWKLFFEEKAAAVFTVHFDATDSYPEQYMVALVLDGGGNTINVIQWAAKVQGIDSVALGKERTKWADLFVQKAKDAVSAKLAAAKE